MKMGFARSIEKERIEEEDERWKVFSASCRIDRSKKDGRLHRRDRTEDNCMRFLLLLKKYTSTMPEGLRYHTEVELWKRGNFVPERIVFKEMRDRDDKLQWSEIARWATRMKKCQLIIINEALVETNRKNPSKTRLSRFYRFKEVPSKMIEKSSNARFETLDQKKERILGPLRPYLPEAAEKLGIGRQGLEDALRDAIR